MTDQGQIAAAWHALDAGAVYAKLETAAGGISSAEAARRLERYGPNALPRQAPPPGWLIFLRQFKSPLIYILAIAALVSLAIGDVKDAGFIAAVLLLNAVIGAYEEWRAERSAQALQKLLKTRAAVERDGDVSEIDAEGVVPGDVVWVESGNRVPADLRLTTVRGLEVDESLLTGESLPVFKDARWQGSDDAPLGDRQNMLHAGSIVTRGRGKGVTVATGMATSVGELALDVMGTGGGPPPLVMRMRRFTHAVAWTILAAAAALGGLGFLIGTYPPSELFLFSIAMVVSTVPEGLPVAMTIALAIATTRMARHGVIVRRLTAVEGLGSCTLIATDKTGTLTCNELTVRELQLPSGAVYEVSGEGFAPSGEVEPRGTADDEGLEALIRCAVLCNEADLHRRDGDWTWRGDAVDVALLSLGHKRAWVRELVIDRYPQINQIPFEPEHKFAATYHNVEDAVMVFVKGAPERVLAMCGDGQQSNAGEWMAAAEALAGQGYRVLAFAEGTVAGRPSPDTVPPPPTDLRFLGFAGMIDPLRPGARDAVQACHKAGISVCMVTGDHRVTALAIARDLGLADDTSEVLTGETIAEMSEEELTRQIGGVRVFARVEPRQKLAIVRAALRAGHFVAVTGDGANDAPALREANVGVAMGRAGTDVAREASELVISDDNFATIVAGVAEGRVAYDNIRKVIYFLISTGAAEMLLMAFAIATQSPLPLLPVQILWLNLVTTGIQDVALAFEPGEHDVLRRKPRAPSESIFNRLMIERTLLAAVIIAGLGFAVFQWQLANGWALDDARNNLLLLVVLMKSVHLGSCRSETKSAFVLSPLRSPVLLIGTVVSLLIHVAALYLPVGHAFLGTYPVPLEEWVIYLALAAVVFPVMELHKWIWNMRIGDASAGKTG